MPNPRPIAAFLLEAKEEKQEFAYLLIDRFRECGFEIPSAKYWRKYIRNREIADARAEKQIAESPSITISGKC